MPGKLAPSAPCSFLFLHLSVLLAFCCVFMPAATGIAQENSQDAAQKEADDEKQEEELETIESKSADWIAHPGYQPFFHEVDEGKIWLKIEDWDREFLFSYGLGTGLGSNPVGLDRGQLGDQLVCQFRRVGKKVLLVARNLDYRALSENAIERRSVRESFAESILWGGQVAAQTDKAVLVDVTGLLTSDLHGVVTRLKESEQGDFSLDESRSAIFVDRCKAFPENTELEATLTFSGQNPGRLVAQVTPSARNVSLRQHVSFVKLPDDEYLPRLHHPRCASIHINFADYAAPIQDRLQKRWIIRHRLVKKDPSANPSEAVEPIVYYVDPGAPELIRDALIDGARWWNQAFEAAGFVDAFQVKVLPDDADPMDVRYNVIQWVHRSTRGWSYGGSVIDPRTGEIIKGHVTLGSLRVRQDRLLFEAMGAKGLAGCGGSAVREESTLAALAEQIDPVEIALARIRQLSAHEVGHTLGFVHNFAASTWDDRASVMDYPAPRVKIDAADKLDLSDAYGVGIGSWDKWSVQYAYTQFNGETPDAEWADLKRLVKQAIDANMVFVSDADARPSAAAHPFGNLWDNGTDPVEELKHVMNVRRIALDSLKPELLRTDDPASDFQQLFVPMYLHHRYQVDAVAKMIGGVTYSYDSAEFQQPMTAVPEAEQVKALLGLFETIAPEQLLIKDATWEYLIPAPFSTHRNVEQFEGITDPVFDRESAARIAADLTIGNLLQPERVSRLGMIGRGNSFGPRVLVTDLVDFVWDRTDVDEPTIAVSEVVKQSLIEHLLRLSESSKASTQAKACARLGIERVMAYLIRDIEADDANFKPFATQMRAQIERFQDRPYPQVQPPQALSAPPGSPIGQSSGK